MVELCLNGLFVLLLLRLELLVLLHQSCTLLLHRSLFAEFVFEIINLELQDAIGGFKDIISSLNLGVVVLWGLDLDRRLGS